MIYNTMSLKGSVVITEIQNSPIKNNQVMGKNQMLLYVSPLSSVIQWSDLPSKHASHYYIMITGDNDGMNFL